MINYAQEANHILNFAEEFLKQENIMESAA